MPSTYPPIWRSSSIYSRTTTQASWSPDRDQPLPPLPLQPFLEVPSEYTQSVQADLKINESPVSPLQDPQNTTSSTSPLSPILPQPELSKTTPTRPETPPPVYTPSPRLHSLSPSRSPRNLSLEIPIQTSSRSSTPQPLVYHARPPSQSDAENARLLGFRQQRARTQFRRFTCGFVLLLATTIVVGVGVAMLTMNRKHNSNNLHG